MSATTIWKDKTTNDLEQTIKSLVDEVKPDEKSSIVWGDWDIHKKFDKNKEIELGGKTIKYNYISYSYSQYYTKELKDQSKVFKSGFIIVYSNSAGRSIFALLFHVHKIFVDLSYLTVKIILVCTDYNVQFFYCHLLYLPFVASAYSAIFCFDNSQSDTGIPSDLSRPYSLGNAFSMLCGYCLGALTPMATS